MGRIKELLLEDEEQELIMKASKQLSMAYADLLNPNDIFKNNCSIIQIVTADGETHTFAPEPDSPSGAVRVRVRRLYKKRKSSVLG